MKLEVLIYLIIALILMSVRRVISGMKNGAFYGKNNPAHNPKLDDYISNLHYLETPAWYSQFGGVFFFVLAIFRLVDYNTEWILIVKQVLASVLVTMGCSALASYHFQGWINYGEGSPFYNPKEDKKSEFAVKLFGKKISIWWNRGVMDKYKKLVPILGFVVMLIGIYIGFFNI